MPSTGGPDKGVTGTLTDPGPGNTGASKVSKSGSMRIKRTTSSAKVLTKSKSSGSLKKKGAELAMSPSSASAGGGGGGGGGGGRPARDSHRSSSTSAETDLPDPKQNGSLRRGGVVGEEEEEEDEVWEAGEEKKEPSIKGLWKKAVKTMKGPTSDSKKPNRPKRRDSKYDAEETEEEPKEIDPVYSLLKCAADLPKIARSQNKEGQQLSCQGALCLAKASAAAASAASSSQGGPLHRTSSSSFSSGSMCVSCRGLQNEGSSSGPTAHSLGHDFKQFYKQTSPVKRLSSSSTELGI